MENWIVNQMDGYISIMMPGHELDQFEILHKSESNYLVKIPLRNADCIYTTKFHTFDKAMCFVQYHMANFR